MKLAGRWETRNSTRRFVRDEPVEPPAPGPLPLLRFHDVFKPRRTASEELRQNCNLRSGHLKAHKALLERRARGIYDRPRISDYAFALVRAAQLVEADDGELTEIERIMLAASVQNDIRLIKLAESFR